MTVAPAPGASFEFAPLTPDPDAVPGGQGIRLAQAADVLETARAEAEGIRAAARDEGFQAGFQAGMTAADERIAPALSALAAATTALDEARLSTADLVEREAVELALAIAEKALGAAIEARPELVVDVVRGGLRRLIEREHVIVMVSPDDLEIVRDAVDGLIAQLGGIGSLEVQAERRVGRGGAIVRTAAGEVDGRLETQLARARETLVEALSS